MRSKLKQSLVISINCLVISATLNVIGWLAVYFHPHIGNEIMWYELLLMSLFYSVLIFPLLVVFGADRTQWLIPLCYLIVSLMLTSINELSGFDLLFVLNFGFSQLCYFLYSILRGFESLTNPLLDKIVFNGLFFIYQLSLLYWAKRSNIFWSLRFDYKAPKF